MSEQTYVGPPIGERVDAGEPTPEEQANIDDETAKLEAEQTAASEHEALLAAAPRLDYIYPNTAVVGADPLTLRAVGAGFVDGAVIVWNEGDEATVFVSDGELTTDVQPATASGPGTLLIQIRNPDGGLSNPLSFAFLGAAA